MQSLVELIRDGIAAKDWNKIQEAYRLLNGEALKPPLKVKLRKPKKQKVTVVGQSPIPPIFITPQSPDNPMPQIPKDFAIVHGKPVNPQTDDGRRQARKLPFEPGMTNAFHDDGKLAQAEGQFDKKVLPAAPGPRRPPMQFLSIRCCRCGITYQINPKDAPRRVAGDDDASSYICNDCIPRKRQ